MVREMRCGVIYRGKVEQVNKLANLHRPLCATCSQQSNGPTLLNVAIASSLTGKQILKPSDRHLAQVYEQIANGNVAGLSDNDVLSKDLSKVPGLTLAPE